MEKKLIFSKNLSLKRSLILNRYFVNTLLAKGGLADAFRRIFVHNFFTPLHLKTSFSHANSSFQSAIRCRYEAFISEDSEFLEKGIGVHLFSPSISLHDFFFISTFSAQSDTLIALSLKILTEVREEEDYPVLLNLWSGKWRKDRKTYCFQALVFWDVLFQSKDVIMFISLSYSKGICLGLNEVRKSNSPSKRGLIKDSYHILEKQFIKCYSGCFY